MRTKKKLRILWTLKKCLSHISDDIFKYELATIYEIGANRKERKMRKSFFLIIGRKLHKNTSSICILFL